MSNLNEVVNAMFEKQPTPDELELRQLAQELFSEANRLLAIMKRPENRELARFAFAWHEMRLKMADLKRVINERLPQVEKQDDPLAVFFQ